MGEHIIDGEFQSDKYPWCKRGFVPLKITDPMAQKPLYAYAQKRREVDAEFSDDLCQCLLNSGYVRPEMADQKEEDRYKGSPLEKINNLKNEIVLLKNELKEAKEWLIKLTFQHDPDEQHDIEMCVLEFINTSGQKKANKND